ncbi:MAG: hypothetical protein OQL06_02370 [Gammaproteobacteria bacterium]|nr:hypothetical protein [Gammaproteobacteria bacterium]
MSKTVLTIIESPTFPKFIPPLLHDMGYREIQVTSMRKAMAAVKTHQPDFIIAEFFYGYGNNYAGVNVSNLDVLLSSLPRYSPDTKTIVFVMKDEQQYVGKLHELYPIQGAFLHTTPQHIIEEVLDESEA